jgi:hypothetical protein
MNGFTPAGGGAAAAAGPTGFSVKARRTAKARHRDDRARVTAHARAVARTGKDRELELGELDAPLPPPEQEQVPLVRRAGEKEEAPREHVRRDIGSHVAVFELGAPDNPEGLRNPFTDPRGAVMRWGVRCLTHGETEYHAQHRRALQAVKRSPAWCPGCAAAIESSRSRRIHKRARALHRRTSP